MVILWAWREWAESIPDLVGRELEAGETSQRLVCVDLHSFSVICLELSYMHTISVFTHEAGSEVVERELRTR